MCLLTDANVSIVTASHTIFCIHQSVTMTCQMTKTSVEQCSLRGCANVSLWLRVGNPISAFQSDKRYFTKDEHWGAFQSSSAISTSVWLKWVLTNWNYWYKNQVHRYQLMHIISALVIRRCLTVDHCSCFTGVVLGETLEMALGM